MGKARKLKAVRLLLRQGLIDVPQAPQDAMYQAEAHYREVARSGGGVRVERRMETKLATNSARAIYKTLKKGLT